MKPCLSGHGVVASLAGRAGPEAQPLAWRAQSAGPALVRARPRDTPGYRCGLRLALTRNASPSLVPLFLAHHTGVFADRPAWPKRSVHLRNNGSIWSHAAKPGAGLWACPRAAARATSVPLLWARDEPSLRKAAPDMPLSSALRGVQAAVAPADRPSRRIATPPATPAASVQFSCVAGRLTMWWPASTRWSTSSSSPVPAC